MSSFHFQIIALKNSHFEFLSSISQLWPVFRRMTHIIYISSCTVTSLMKMEEQGGKTLNVCAGATREQEFWGRTSKTGIKKITCVPCASFLLHDCAGLCGGHLLCTPVLIYMGSFSYMPSAGLRVEFLLHIFLWGVSLIRSMLASLCREFLLYKTKRNVKVNKNAHSWVMFFFKAEADIQYRLH